MSEKEPGPPVSEAKKDSPQESGPPPLSQNQTPPTFGGGAQIGTLNQQQQQQVSPFGASPANTATFGGFAVGGTGNTDTFQFANNTNSAFGGTAGNAAAGGFGFGTGSNTCAFGTGNATTGFGGASFGTGGGFGTAQPAAATFGGVNGGGGGLFGGQQQAGSTKKRGPRTLFYLVCGGQLVPEKEKQNREQMNFIYRLLVEKNMASKDNIRFIYGRGNKLNSSVKSFEATGVNFLMYGPNQRQNQAGLFGAPAIPNNLRCPLPGQQDNAVVIFIGQGKYSSQIGNSGGFGFGAPAAPAAPVMEFGDLLFVNNFSNVTVYKPLLRDLRAQNTLFISLADYSGESFRRTFKESSPQRSKNLYVLCLSESLQSHSDHCLAEAFSDFLDGDWKNQTLEKFVDAVEDKFMHHPAVELRRQEVAKCTEETYNVHVDETASWATGNFHDLNLKRIPPYDWAMFRQVEELKQTLEDANVGEVSTDLKDKLDTFVTSMEDLRTDAIEYNLHLPVAFETVGDKDMAAMTWRDFLHDHEPVGNE